jgi:acetyltransferase-like isoleucine patch superfamily enzyme
MNTFYTHDELVLIGFNRFGDNVLISRKASIISPEKMQIGNHVRIDDFCLLSGEIHIGSFVHISAFTALYGRNGIFIEDYAGVSPRCTIFSATDDFSGEFLIGPMVDQKYTNILGGPVFIKKYVQIGAGCVVLPNVTIKEGSVIGAMSLVNKSIESWLISAGIPIRTIKKRSKNLLNYLNLDKNLLLKK